MGICHFRVNVQLLVLLYAFAPDSDNYLKCAAEITQNFLSTPLCFNLLHTNFQSLCLVDNDETKAPAM